MRLNFTAIGISIFLFFMGMNDVNAFHIVGGEITYECIGADEYKALLTVYRDCNCGNCGDLDDTAHVFVFRKDSIGAIPQFYNLYKVPRPPKTPVGPPINLCIEDPLVLSSVCVEKADYEFELFLPASVGGYDIIYQRYSRNSTLNNINQPAQTGSTYMTSIPPFALAVCNSSPVFKEFPPTMLCTGLPFSLDQSATDVNGDSLVYEFCNPIIGGSDNCPSPGVEGPNGSCATIGPPPYSPVSWSIGYDAQNPLGQDVMTLNPSTGRLSGTAPPSGQYVVGICVSEYRNGELLNTIRRDFQFNVIECEASVAQVESDDVTANGEYLFNTCNDLTVNFVNTSLKANRFIWDFGVPNTTSDTSTEPNPSFQYPDTGRYVGQLIAIYETPDFFCVDTAEIIVLMYPLVDSNFESDIVCYYEATTFTNTSTSTYGNLQTFTWDFGDGSTSTEVNPVHQYETGGTYLVKLTTLTDLGCQITSEKEIYVVPKVADFSTTLKCPGVPINFVNETSIPTSSWQWDFGEPSSGTDNTSTLENPSHIYGAIGDYTVTFYTESVEGCKDTTDLSFTIYPEFLVDAGLDIEVCFGDTIPLSVTPSHLSTPYTYIWSPETSLDDVNLQNPNLSMNYEGPRNYSVEVRDPNGCINSDQVEVMGLPLPDVNAPENFDLCFESETTLNGTTGSNVVSFEWRTDAGLLISDTELTPTVSPDTITHYILSAIDNKTCENQDTVSIQVIPAVVFDASLDTSICYGESVQLNAFSEGAESYAWQADATLSDLTIYNPIATPTDTVDYIVTGSNSCFDIEDVLKIAVIPTPEIDAGEDVIINIGESTMLDVTGIWDFEWLPNDNLSGTTSSNPLVSPFEDATFYVMTTDVYGCQSMDSVRVIVERNFDIIMPTAFSPNRDGNNDEFSIGALRGIDEILDFKIFTRWGQEVFSTNDVTKGWDGDYDFRPMGVGTYVYQIRVVNVIGEEMVWSGNFTLIR